MKKIMTLAICICMANFISAQEVAKATKDCTGFYQKQCYEVLENFNEGKDKNALSKREMKLDGQSRSALFSKGDTAQLKMRAYEGQEYRLTFCLEPIFGESNLEYQIFERKRKLIDWKRYDDSLFAIEAAKYRLDSIKQDSIMKLQMESTNYEYYDNYTESDDAAFGVFGNYGSYDTSIPLDDSKRPKYKVVKKLLYDNTKDNYSPVVNFAAKETKSLIIEIMIPGDSPENDFVLEERGCVGALIEHVNISKTGF